MENFIWFLLLALFISQLHFLTNLIYKEGYTNKIVMYTVRFIYFVGTVFSNVNTLVHEIGHVIGAVVTRGKVYKVELDNNRGGVAETSSTSFIGSVITSFSGYPFASFVSLLFVFLLINENYNLLIYILVATLIGSILFLVRNAYGLVWCFTFLTITLVVDNYFNDYLVYFVSFVTAILVVNSVTTAIHIFYLSLFNKDESGDALNLAQKTKIPAFLWGFSFLAISTYVGYLNYLLLSGSQLF